MIAVLWRTASRNKNPEVEEWISTRLSRIIVEFALPRSAWTVAVIEMNGIGPLPRLRTPPEVGLMSTDNEAHAMQHARRMFEARFALEASSRPVLPRRFFRARGSVQSSALRS